MISISQRQQNVAACSPTHEKQLTRYVDVLGLNVSINHHSTISVGKVLFVAFMLEGMACCAGQVEMLEMGTCGGR
jgi:ribose/xylose/arabinose/galactoside ABC-type transport system permease subunit